MILSFLLKSISTADQITNGYGTTITNLPLTQSRTGSAFTQTQRTACFPIPSTEEIWMKFDVYSGGGVWRAHNYTSNLACGITKQSDGRISFFANSNNVGDFSGLSKQYALQTFILHMQINKEIENYDGATIPVNGVIEAWVDGEKIFCYEGNVNNKRELDRIYLQGETSTYFSNVYVSDGALTFDTNELNYKCEIKPEIFATWIPTGKIFLKPERFYH